MSSALHVTRTTQPFEQEPTKQSNLCLPAVLVILDGFGLSKAGEGNAISRAHTPYFDQLMQTCPHTTLGASGLDVGLPQGQMGNSEVGHLNIGAGRIIYQELTRIDQAIQDGSLAKNPRLIKAIQEAKRKKATIHLMGLISDGGVHSHMSHCIYLMNLAAEHGCPVMIHAFTDGRDCAPQSGKGFLRELQKACKQTEEAQGTQARIATITGRYYAMDRDNRWERVSQAYRALVDADAPSAPSAEQVMDASYAQGVTDEFIAPHIIADNSAAFTGISPGDTCIFFNFRPDRARELTRALIDPNFKGFERPFIEDLDFLTLTEYDPQFEADLGASVIFPKELPKFVLADFCSAQGLYQYHTAETEKYAHVTFFLNGGAEALKEGETRVLVDSPKVSTYDLQPEMSAFQVTDTLIDAINAGQSDVYIVNYANCDMVGHTGNLDAAIQAVEAIDACLNRLIEAVRRNQGFALITADHGNADCMFDPSDPHARKPYTAHSLARVPLIYVPSPQYHEMRQLTLANADELDPSPRLSDIAPTFVELIGLRPPDLWTGRSLVKDLHKTC